MKIAIGVFAKTPDLSPVKTRLAQTIGIPMADVFYKKSVAGVAGNLRDLKIALAETAVTKNEALSLSIYWALAEEEGVNSPFWKGKTCLWTGAGSLGQRLNQVSKALFENHDYVFVMGTDSPQVGAAPLLKALVTMVENRGKAIVGPCSDGGFYLFGMENPLGESFWTHIQYSQGDTCQQLIDSLKEKAQAFEILPAYGDVDVAEDLIRLKKELLENQEALNEEQKDLLNWLLSLENL